MCIKYDPGLYYIVIRNIYREERNRRIEHTLYTNKILFLFSSHISYWFMLKIVSSSFQIISIITTINYHLTINYFVCNPCRHIRCIRCCIFESSIIIFFFLSTNNTLGFWIHQCYVYNHAVLENLYILMLTRCHINPKKLWGDELSYNKYWLFFYRL